MPKLTVLMPVYNAEKHLREAVESILKQSFSDFEFLIIDDGSKDHSVEIINSFDDKRIRLMINDQNMGISKTLNKGIKLASCNVIARMDADDISLPERLEKQFDFLSDNPDYCLVSANVEKITEGGETLQKFEPDPDFIYFNLTFHCYGIFHPTVMYRKKAVEDVGMYPLTHSEDFRLWCKLIRNFRIHNIPEILVKYRVWSESISHERLFKEYKDDERLNIIDNLHYFAGDNYSIPDAWLEAYRNNFKPLTHPPNIEEMIQCIQELDVISEHILAKENINRDPDSIKRAAEFKKNQLFESFLKNISIVDRVRFLLKTGNYFRMGRTLLFGAYIFSKKLIKPTGS